MLNFLAKLSTSDAQFLAMPFGLGCILLAVGAMFVARALMTPVGPAREERLLVGGLAGGLAVIVWLVTLGLVSLVLWAQPQFA